MWSYLYPTSFSLRLQYSTKDAVVAQCRSCAQRIKTGGKNPINDFHVNNVWQETFIPMSVKTGAFPIYFGFEKCSTLLNKGYTRPSEAIVIEI